MICLISLLLAAAGVAVGRDYLKKHAGVCYVISALLALCVVGMTAAGASAALPGAIRTWVWPIFAQSALSTALFILVMYAGALSNTSALKRVLMPIRGELSILACILTLGHNISFGMTYFRLLFTRPDRLPVNQLLAAVCSLVMLCIMLPLFVTSFPAVRRKMKGSSWKRLQRLAYVFYALIYAHVLLLELPGARQGNGKYLVNVVVYTVIFGGYAALRIRKALAKQPAAVRSIPVAAVACAALLVCASALVPGFAGQTGAEQPAASSAQEPAASEETGPEDDTAAVSAAASSSEEEAPEEPEDQPAGEAPEETPAETVPPVETEQPAKEQPATAPAAAGTAAAEAPKKETPAQAPAAAAPAEPAQPKEPEVTYQYRDGTFTGSGEGFEGTITVSVSIEKDRITGISVVSASDDDPYWSEGKGVISRILSAQSANVDTVSGATFSSGGIIQAVKAALSSAKN